MPPKSATVKNLEPKSGHKVEKNTEFITGQTIDRIMFVRQMTIKSKADADTLSMASTERFDIYDYGDRVVLEPAHARGSRCVLFPGAIAYISLVKND